MGKGAAFGRGFIWVKLVFNDIYFMHTGDSIKINGGSGVSPGFNSVHGIGYRIK